MFDDPLSAIVVDASIAIAIARREPAATAARSLLRVRAGGRLLVPDHFWIELTNVLVRRYSATAEETVEALRELDEVGFESVRIDRPLLLAGIDLQQRHGLSAYDAIYLALAEAEDAQLLTLDARLANAAGDRAVWLEGMRPPGLAEERAVYGGDPIDWARFGPYLARLRADARDKVRDGI
ncbi:MAG TPA: type II toxin-antitoxin system VapC family toxin [Candidatus Eisenbacteria bacterium]|nr:type II toxin-antitoxin system VapC family toxin [Candidatus Eisenbacteria bacterium]